MATARPQDYSGFRSKPQHQLRNRHNSPRARPRAQRARGLLAAALDRIEQQRQGAYLVADAFTVADLTAAAMLSPILQPPEIQ
jgi:glutathione S-transferase